MDVNSLYIAIPHSDVEEACRSLLSIKTTEQTLINDIPTLVDFILKHNLFVFGDKQYLPINGAVMGKKWKQHTPIFICISLKNHIILDLISTNCLFQIYRWHFACLAKRYRYFKNVSMKCWQNSTEHKIHTWVLYYICFIFGCNNWNQRWNYIH